MMVEVKYYRFVKDYFTEPQNVFKEGMVYPSNYPYGEAEIPVEVYVENCKWWGKVGFWEEVEKEIVLN